MKKQSRLFIKGFKRGEAPLANSLPSAPMKGRSIKGEGLANNPKQSIGVGLMGLGVTGGQVARVLADRAEVLAEQVGCPLALKKVKVLARGLTRPQAVEMGLQLFTTDTDTALKRAKPFLELPADLVAVEQALGWS